MRKKIQQLKKKYSAMTAVQQKFIRYIIFIKLAIFVLCGALLGLAWYVLMKN